MELEADGKLHGPAYREQRKHARKFVEAQIMLEELYPPEGEDPGREHGGGKLKQQEQKQ